MVTSCSSSSAHWYRGSPLMLFIGAFTRRLHDVREPFSDVFLSPPNVITFGIVYSTYLATHWPRLSFQYVPGGQVGIAMLAVAIGTALAGAA